MPAVTKAKDGMIAADTAAEVTYKAAEEAKVMMDTFVEAADKATEDTYALLNAQQKIWQSTFEMWQQYNKRYFDFVTEATQRSWEQSFAQWEQMGKVMNNNLKKAQELMMAEQNLVLEAGEESRTKMQTTFDRFAKWFAPDFK